MISNLLFFLFLITQENIDVYSCLKGTWVFFFIYNVYTKTDDLTCVYTRNADERNNSTNSHVTKMKLPEKDHATMLLKAWVYFPPNIFKRI